jgi:hypothetical protein
MRTHNRAEISMRVFNANPFAVKISQLEGHIYLRRRMPDLTSDEVKLGAPVLITDRAPPLAEPRSEFLVLIHQPLTSDEIAAIEIGLRRGQVTFDIRKLRIELASASGQSASTDLKISLSPNVSRANDGDFIYHTTILGTANVTLGAKTTEA